MQYHYKHNIKGLIMAFGMAFRNLKRNLMEHPFLTALTLFYITFNFLVTKFKIRKLFGFLNAIKIKIKLPDGNILVCKIPDLITINEIYFARVYDSLDCPDGSLIVDAGANIGVYSLRMATQKRNAIIVAVEPLGENFVLLKENIEKNGLRNIIPVNVALDRKTGHTKLFYNKAQGTTASFIIGENTQTEEVRSVRLDDLLPELGIDIRDKRLCIKMDVEGAELNVLEGAQNLLKNKNISILMETHPWLLAPEKLETFLKSHGFETKLLDLNQPFILARKQSKLHNVAGIRGNRVQFDHRNFS